MSIFKFNTRWKLALLYYLPVFLLVIGFSVLILDYQRLQITSVMVAVDSASPDENLYLSENYYTDDQSSKYVNSELFEKLDQKAEEYDRIYQIYKSDYRDLNTKKIQTMYKLNRAIELGDTTQIASLQSEFARIASKRRELDIKSGLAQLIHSDTAFVTSNQLPTSIFGDYMQQKIEEDALNSVSLYTYGSLACLLLVLAVITYFISGKLVSPLEQALEKQKLFVANASHELRTPLALIKTESEVFQKIKRPTHADYSQFSQNIVLNIDRLHELTSRLLNLASIDANPSKSLAPKIDIDPIIKSVLADNAKIWLSVEFTYKPAMQPVLVAIQTDDCRQLFSVLIDNAAKYNKAHGQVGVSIEYKKNKYVVTIVDTGRGIAKTDIPIVFEKFRRATKDQATPGFDLGLALAKEICAAYNIGISLTSEEGQGTIVTLSFPKA